MEGIFDMKKRWYDKHDKIAETIEIMSKMDFELQNQIAGHILSAAKALRDFHKEEPQPELSLGLNRVLGLYNYEKKRRWYDKKSYKLQAAMKAISTLNEDDYKAIMESIHACL